MKLYRICLLLIMVIFFTTGCTQNLEESIDEAAVTSVIETTDTAINREHRVIFSCYATDGLAAYTLTKLIYEQPLLNENVNLEYTVFSDVERFNMALEEAEHSIVVLPFEEAVQVVHTEKGYSLVGIVQVDDDLSLMVMMTEDVLEHFPEIAKGFTELYSSACKWNTDQKERALAYAEQLKIRSNIDEEFPEKVVYMSAFDGITIIEEALQSEIFEDLDINKVLESVSRYF